MVRLNTGKKIPVQEAPFILTRVDPWTKEIRHTYIQSAGQGHFLARIHVDSGHKSKMHEAKSASVKDLLQQLFKFKVKLNDKKTEVPFIESICPGYPFADLFVPKKKAQSSLSRHSDSSDSLHDSADSN